MSMTNPYNKKVLARISDLSGGNPELKTLVLSAVSGTSTISGFFVDAQGDQLGQAITIAITTATTLENKLTSQQKIDSGWNTNKAVGMIGRLSGSDMYIGTGGNALDGSIRSGMSPTTTYPEIPVTEYFTLGRVAAVVNTGTPPTTTTGGSGSGSGNIVSDNTDLNYYVLVSESGTSTASIEVLNTDGVVVYQGVLSVTSTAKSFDNWLTSATPTGTYDSEMDSVRIYNVSGSAMLINTAGNGLPATNNGVTSGKEPTLVYSTRIPVGLYNMQQVGFGRSF